MHRRREHTPPAALTHAHCIAPVERGGPEVQISGESTQRPLRTNPLGEALIARVDHVAIAQPHQPDALTLAKALAADWRHLREALPQTRRRSHLPQPRKNGARFEEMVGAGGTAHEGRAVAAAQL